MKKKITKFYDAFWFLCEHEIFQPENNYDKDFLACLDIDVQKINPKTNKIDDNEKLNTKVEVWLECGRYVIDEHFDSPIHEHDIRLDCGGNTFEEAIIGLANLVRKYYK